jgi:hypothetical protein
MNSWIWFQSGIHDGHRARCATIVIAVRFSLFRNVVPPALVTAVGEGRLSRRRTSLASRASDPLERSCGLQRGSSKTGRIRPNPVCDLSVMQPAGSSTFINIFAVYILSARILILHCLRVWKRIFSLSLLLSSSRRQSLPPDDEPGSCVLPSASVKVPVQFGSMRLSNTSH